MTWNELVEQITTTLTEEERQQKAKVLFWDEHYYVGWDVELLRASEDKLIIRDFKRTPFLKWGEPYLA